MSPQFVLHCRIDGAVVAELSPAHRPCFVTLADNQYQGIPVPARLGNGDDPDHNPHWGSSAYGVKTFFSRSSKWVLVTSALRTRSPEFWNAVYSSTAQYLVADAYRGREIRQAILGFLDAGRWNWLVAVQPASPTVILNINGGSNLVAYIEHDGLMDSQLPLLPQKKDDLRREAMVLACASESYFAGLLRACGRAPCCGRPA